MTELRGFIAGAIGGVISSLLIEKCKTNSGDCNNIYIDEERCETEAFSKKNIEKMVKKYFNRHLDDIPTGCCATNHTVTGPQGACGSQGPCGAVGSCGPQGPPGACGSCGPTGPSGNCGSSGSTGASGSTGPCGCTGPTGTAGTTGPTGSAGPTGPSGSSNLTQNFNTSEESTGNTPGTTGPLRQTSTHYEFDSTYLGPHYGTNSTLGNNSIVMGYHENLTVTGGRILIGSGSGNSGGASNNIAIGTNAGGFSQGNSSISIGDNAGRYDQGNGAIAIGYSAGLTGQVENSICLGSSSRVNTQDENDSLNRISLNMKIRDNTFTDGGAIGTQSFVLSNFNSTINTVVNDGSSAETLASKYFNVNDNVGFLNVSIIRGSTGYVGFVPLLNLKTLSTPSI